MTRKNYRSVAEVIHAEVVLANHYTDSGNRVVAITICQNVMRSLADAFKQDNSAFDRSRFYVACGFDPTGFHVLDSVSK